MASKIDYFCSDAVQQDLKGKTVRGGVYTAASQAGVTLIQLAAMSILARLLLKPDFGLVDMAMIFTGFAAMFVDAGMSMATIQRPKITHRQVSNLFWLSMGLGGLMALVSAVSAPAVAWFFGKPELVPLVIALGSAFLFSGMTVQHKALMVRSMQFRELAGVTLVSTFLARCVAVWLAWQYESYWALVAGQVALAVFTMLACWWVSGWHPSLPSRGSGVRTMAGFGANVSGSNTLRWFARNADKLLIGKFVGVAELGVYGQAYRLFLQPVSRINGPINAVAVPALSRLTDQPDRYRKYYCGMVGKLSLITIPLAGFMCCAAHLVVPSVLGPGWEGAIPILRALAIAGIFQTVGGTLSWLYLSQGRGNEMLRNAFVNVPMIILGYVVGLQWGALGVAVSYAAVVSVFNLPYNTYMATRRGPVGALDVIGVFGRNSLLIIPAVMGVVVQALVLPGGAVIPRCILAFVFSALFVVTTVWLWYWEPRSEAQA